MSVKEFLYVQGPTFIAGFLGMLAVICICHDSNIDLPTENIVSIQEDLVADENAILNQIIAESISIEDVRNQTDLESNYNKVFSNSIVGIYSIFDGNIMEFSNNGAFCGYYDKNNSRVNDYPYEVIVDFNDEAYIYIYNPEYTEAVIYRFILTDKGKSLIYEPTNFEIKL